VSVEAVKWALYDAPMLLTPAGKPDTTARFVLVVFAECAHKDGSNAYPGPARVKFATGLDIRTVERVVRRLEDGKLLVRDGLTSSGSVKWRLNMDLQRPESDWEEIEAEREAEREAVAARVRKHRAGRTPEPPVTDPASVTGVDVTDPECVTKAHVTDPASVRNGFEVRSVTDAAPGEPPLGTTSSTTTGGTLPPDPLRPQPLRSSEAGTDTSGSGSVSGSPPTSVDQEPHDVCAHTRDAGARVIPFRQRRSAS
jgi:hypothetical protein